MAPAVSAAVEAGVPVITIDRRVEGVSVLAHIGADNVKGGEAQAQPDRRAVSRTARRS